MNKLSLSFFIAAALCSGPALSEVRGMLLPAGSDDLVALQLSASAKAAEVPADFERQPVHFAWKLDAAQPLQTPLPFVAESREFWLDVQGDQMKSGVAIPTTAPGAVVRISPALGEKRFELGSADLSLRIAGRDVAVADAAQGFLDSEQLKAAGTEFVDGTIAFRLKPEIGSGRIELFSQKASGRYLVHVYEPDSAFTMTLSTDRDSALTGQKLGVYADFRGADGVLPMERIAGVLTSPAGASFDLAFARDKSGRFAAQVELPADLVPAPGLWEVHAFGAAKAGDLPILRDARTAVSIARPTARLAGAFSAERKAGTLRFDVDLEVGQGSRYELRGVLYGTAADGTRQPMAIAHSANWLEAGAATLALQFDADVLDSAFKAPFELRQLSLANQATLEKIESRELALRLNAEPSGAAPERPTPIER